MKGQMTGSVVCLFRYVRLYKSGEICYTKSKLLAGRIRLAVGRLSSSFIDDDKSEFIGGENGGFCK